MIRKFLTPLNTHLGYRVFSDKDLNTGELWDDRLKQEVCSAKLAILLISPDFINSSYIREHELPILLDGWKRGEVKLFPIMLRHTPTSLTPYKFPNPETGPHFIYLSDIQFFNDPINPLNSLSDSEIDAWLATLAKAVADCLSAVDQIKSEDQTSSTEVRPTLMPGSIDTFDKPVYSWDKNRKVDYIRQFSLGPAYSLDDIDQDVIDAICDSLTLHQFIDLASEINRLRQKADPELKPRQILIPAGALPNPDQGLVNYAYRLLGNVFVRGPRMIVALLLSLPMTIWSEHERELLALLKHLQTPRNATERH
jgi:hypothetical protein